MTTIVLATLNARYIHSALGLRYLLANMGPLRGETDLLEFVTSDRPIDIAERILLRSPRIVGLGVYIWNVEETTKLVRVLKQVAPEVIVVLGGPEVSHEWQDQPIVVAADYLITGPGELALPELCVELLAGRLPLNPVIHAGPPPLSRLAAPYREYTDADIAHRLIYVEASRGCPFRCEFCLSALDERVTGFELDAFLSEMDTLYERGARHFKFVDRTFNLKVEVGLRILRFFLDRMDEQLFLHFELIPDRLPEALKEIIAHFPPGSLQFEIGIQTFDPDVQARISRRQDSRRTEENLRWLRQHTHAHIHADLIVGLPGESLDGFGAGFDRLAVLQPHEIQIGILKRLRGAPIHRHTAEFDMRYNPDPPYTLLSSATVSFQDMQRMTRFARYWDLVANSGRFPCGLRLLLGDAPFRRFLLFSDSLYLQTARTFQISLDRLFEFVFQALTTLFGEDPTLVREQLAIDFARSGLKRVPEFLRGTGKPADNSPNVAAVGNTARRQVRHRQR